MDQDAINRREWANRENWKTPLGLYRSARDRRVWVLKRNPRLGWTPTFAQRAAWWSVAGLLSVPLGLLLLLAIYPLVR